MGAEATLVGYTIGVTADRRSREQATMFERLDADVVLAPVIDTLPIDESVELRARTESLIAEPPDYFIANTGLGVRAWFALAASWGIDEQLREALQHTKVIARGPKAAGAAVTAGVEVWWRAPDEQLASVTERLLSDGVDGATIALQLHGDDRQALTEAVTNAGAKIIELPVYRWAMPGDVTPAQRLIDLCCDGGVDAVTFTSGPAVRNLVEVAELGGRKDDLLDALANRVLVACIGPVCSKAAAEEGVTNTISPERWRLGALVALVADALHDRTRTYAVDDHDLRLQGSAVIVDGTIVRLSDRERALLDVLAAQPGAAVHRDVLMRAVWNDPTADPHVLETTVARLRSKLGAAGRSVETVVRRGYRFAAVPEATATRAG